MLLAFMHLLGTNLKSRLGVYDISFGLADLFDDKIYR